MVQCYYLPKLLPVTIFKKRTMSKDNLIHGLKPDLKFKGKWSGWDENGKLKSICNVINGKPAGKFKLFFESGKLQGEGEISVTSRHLYIGNVKWFYPNGKSHFLFSRKTNDSLNCIQKLWYQNGQIELDRTCKYHDIESSKLYRISSKLTSTDNLFSKGRTIGIQTRFNPDGTLLEKQFYNQEGKFEKIEFYDMGSLKKTVLAKGFYVDHADCFYYDIQYDRNSNGLFNQIICYFNEGLFFKSYHYQDENFLKTYYAYGQNKYDATTLLNLILQGGSNIKTTIIRVKCNGLVIAEDLFHKTDYFRKQHLIKSEYFNGASKIKVRTYLINSEARTEYYNEGKIIKTRIEKLPTYPKPPPTYDFDEYDSQWE